MQGIGAERPNDPVDEAALLNLLSLQHRRSWAGYGDICIGPWSVARGMVLGSRSRPSAQGRPRRFVKFREPAHTGPLMMLYQGSIRFQETELV